MGNLRDPVLFDINLKAREADSMYAEVQSKLRGLIKLLHSLSIIAIKDSSLEFSDRFIEAVCNTAQKLNITSIVLASFDMAACQWITHLDEYSLANLNTPRFVVYLVCILFNQLQSPSILDGAKQQSKIKGKNNFLFVKFSVCRK